MLNSVSAYRDIAARPEKVSTLLTYLRVRANGLLGSKMASGKKRLWSRGEYSLQSSVGVV